MNKKFILKIILISLIIRFLLLLIIEATKNDLGMFLFFDDLSYFNYATSFSSNNLNPLNINDYLQLEKIIGISSSTYYFRINAFIYYFTRSYFSLRVLNSVIAVLVLPVVYLIGKEMFDEKTAKLSTKILAFMPYYLIFPAFLFKDVWIIDRKSVV